MANHWKTGDGGLDELRFGDLSALCFALAAFASPFVLVGCVLVIWGLFFS